MATYTNTRPLLPAGIMTLPASYYTDPAWFAREVDKIYADMWICAGRTEQIAKPGDYFTRQVGNASFIVVRGQDGTISAFHNVCRHRGTLLCSQGEGSVGGRIRCGYHGWTYGLDGRLVSAPYMDKVAGFKAEDYSLSRIAVDTWDGHIFVHLGDRPRPLSDQLAGLPDKFRPWGMDQLRLVERKTYDLRANWKLVIQNYSECLHCPIAHPQLQKYSHFMSGENEPAQPTYLGGYMTLQPGVKTLSLGSADRPAFPGLSEDDARRVYYYAVLPNLLLNLHPDYMMALTLWPTAPDHTQVVCEWHFHPDEIARDGFDPKGAVDFWDLTNRQDWELSDLAQRGIGSRGYAPGPYSNREELLHALDAWVVERAR